MASARAIFQAHVDGLLPESIPIDLQWSMPLSAGVALMPFELVTGDNTITRPPNTTLMWLIPPTTNALAIKLKGAGGDTGWEITPNMPIVVTFQAASQIINVAAPGVTVTLGFI